MASVLVVEDEPAIRASFELLLEDDGYDVASAESVDDAVAQLETRAFDVVVSDCGLPGRSGEDLLELICARWPSTITILITGEPCVESASRAMRAGASDYMAKPLGVE